MRRDASIPILRYRRLSLAICALLLSLAGCEADQAESAAGDTAPGPVTAPAAAPPDPVNDAPPEIPPAEEIAATPRQPAKSRPGLILETLDHGRFDLADHRGNYVIVNFWATWCSPCLAEIPDLSQLAARRADVEVIGLAFEEIDEPTMRAFLKKHPAGYPIAIVDTYNPPADFEPPRGLPLSYLVGPTGAIVERFIGPITGEQVEARIAEHKAAPAAPADLADRADAS